MHSTIEICNEFQKGAAEEKSQSSKEAIVNSRSLQVVPTEE